MAEEQKTQIVNDLPESDTKEVAKDVKDKVEESGNENEDDGDEVVTMAEVLEEMEELEENADAVLGGSDEKECTYFMGYVNRQALYACRTCSEKSNLAKKGGICLACSYQCHEGHELYELYTKRNFRCDCGIPTKFPDVKCTLLPDKKSLNEDNNYNQNFEGKYCVCSRPYPDPENEDDDDVMIQCISCEDWFHGKHLGGSVPTNDDYAEMICGRCMVNMPFLWAYYERVEQPTKRARIDGDEPDEKKSTTPVETVTPAADSGIESSCDSPAVKMDCKLAARKAKKPIAGLRGPTFWDLGWRQEICSCPDCKSLYTEKRCEFLMDETDTCHHYEKQGKEKNISASLMERGISAMTASMPRVQQIEVMHGYNDLKTAMNEYFEEFASSGRVVTPADVKKFFDDFKARQQAQPQVDMSYSCR